MSQRCIRLAVVFILCGVSASSDKLWETPIAFPRDDLYYLPRR